MSLIYNSLKKHEKGLETVETNPISQRLSKVVVEKRESKLIWVAITAFSFSAAVVLFWPNQSQELHVQTVELSTSSHNQPGLVENKLTKPEEPVQHYAIYQPTQVAEQQKNSVVVDVEDSSVKTSQQKDATEVVETSAKPMVVTEIVKAPIVQKPIVVQVKPEPVVVKKVTAPEPAVKVLRTKATVQVDAETDKKPVAPKVAKRIVVQESFQSESTTQAASIKSPSAAKDSTNYFLAIKGNVNAIKQAIRADDFTAAQASLDSLKNVAGLESIIFQRMQSYTALKSKDYALASQGYQKLLSQNPEDLEANMNLVIALSELGQTSTAKHQLAVLDGFYPESSQVKNYKKMIQAKYGY